MLSTSTAFETANELDYKTPMYLVKFDGEAVDYCNHKPTAPDNTLKQYLESISGLNRTVQPEEGTGTVGGVKVKLLDYDGDITTLLSTDASFFARKKTVIKAGYLGMSEADMLSIFTGWVTAIKLSSDGLCYELSVTDPQRWFLRKIFREAETTPVVLSGNAINVALSVMLSTGTGSNGVHDRLAAINAVGVNSDYIDLAGIEAVRDNYFPGTSHKMTFTITEKIKAKQWIEDEILKPLNLYWVVDGQGRVLFKPSKPPIEAIHEVQAFTDDNIIGIPTWDMNLVETINDVEFNYDWDSDNDKFLNQIFFTDQDSVTARGPGKIIKISSKGLTTADNAFSIITRRKNSIFNRYSDPPPIKISAQCFFTQMLSEPGDVVPFTHKLLPDIANGVRGLSLERMEIIKMSVDWKRGRVKIDFLQTGFDKGTSQVITPTMTILSAVDDETFTVSPADAMKYKTLTGYAVQLSNKNMRQKVFSRQLLTVNTTTGVCTCSGWGLTPVAGDIVWFSDYDDRIHVAQKLWGYIAGADNTIGTSGDAAHLIIP